MTPMCMPVEVAKAKRNRQRYGQPKQNDNDPAEQSIRRIANDFAMEERLAEQSPRNRTPKYHSAEDKPHRFGHDRFVQEPLTSRSSTHGEPTEERQDDKNRKGNPKEPRVCSAKRAQFHHLTRNRVQPAV